MPLAFCRYTTLACTGGIVCVRDRPIFSCIRTQTNHIIEFDLCNYWLWWSCLSSCLFFFSANPIPQPHLSLSRSLSWSRSLTISLAHSCSLCHDSSLFLCLILPLSSFNCFLPPFFFAATEQAILAESKAEFQKKWDSPSVSVHINISNTTLNSVCDT